MDCNGLSLTKFARAAQVYSREHFDECLSKALSFGYRSNVMFFTITSARHPDLSQWLVVRKEV